MKNYFAASLGSIAVAQKMTYPYVNQIGWLAISVTTKGVTPGWEMGFAIEITQRAASDTMLFGIGMGIYPANN